VGVENRRARFPLGTSVSLEQLDRDPHALLARLREREPVSWVPALDGWLVTSYELALAVMRDPDRFTVEDPRFSTGVVVGPSMLSLDGEQHARHREPFVAPFRPAAVGDRFAGPVAEEASSLIDALEPAGAAELRRSFAGPLAASIVARALGFGKAEVSDVLGWYEKIVAGVTQITAGRGIPDHARQAFTSLSVRLQAVISGGDRSSLLTAAAAGAQLTPEQITSNAAVLLFGGIETTEGMIANAVLLLLQHPDELARVRADPALVDVTIEESLRLEPAAAVIDRYASGDVELGAAGIRAGDLVRISLSAANRDPAVFSDPDRFDLGRAGARSHIAFAQGPHVCLGIHLARLEARTALGRLLARFPRLRLDPRRPAAVSGLVFRKPETLHVLWGPE
jgi:cytochrome P450